MNIHCFTSIVIFNTPIIIFQKPEKIDINIYTN